MPGVSRTASQIAPASQSRTIAHSPAPDERRWRAVLRRDRSADGEFVFAVRSTGIYCRPSCPARRPQRSRVSFYADPASAAAAGYRACRRCHPDAPAGASEAARAQAERVRAACRLLEEAEERLTLAGLAARLGCSPWHLQRTFKRVTGLTPRQYAAAHRLERAKQAMRAAETVTTAYYDAGYGSSRGFYEQASGRLGMAPRAYRDGGSGERIAWTIGACELGRVLVASTGRGICALRLGEDEEALAAELAAEFPAAELVRDDRGLRELRRVVEAAIGGGESDQIAAALPLDLRATAFEARVWEALRRIPRGETRSYSELARAVGQPRAVRAVARACGANPVAVLVPCHRVVGSRGELRGYRWGLERKRALLDRERS